MVHLLAAAVLFAGCTSPRPAGPDASAQVPAVAGAFRSQLVEEVTGTGALVHLEALQRIADAHDGNRATPGPGYDASVDYVAGVLRDAGFDVSTPSFVLHSDDGERATVRNVVAQTRTGDPQQVVMAGAHLDSVPEGPGINDNASGVAALLEAAIRMGGSPPVPNTVRLAFWAAEERNLDGSVAYVDSLPRSDHGAIALYLNLDMLASPNAGYFVQGGHGDDESETGPEGSEVVGRMLVEELAATGVTAELARFENDGSDYEAFIEEGIPTGGVYSGDSGVKTSQQAERWGGRAGAVFDPCYHTACDRAAGIHPGALDNFSDAIAGTVARFAESTETIAR
ncbi:M20/M25/M40 family metallo-hydrolase [Pseudonocardia cypriaca]|uniref:M20/M25/M40 family metallo-hydrolase n=1 Tax=Pseudonocardia cypriaca TaxID=882449 RepID=UPI0011523D8F|nr:M20/M25/M40 family metallo-hydrolase [Pseudonocardia cypriaca]